VSNVTAAQLEELVASAPAKPTFVQNRCYAARGWDADVRAVCDAHGLVYQGFSLLTANRAELAHDEVRAIANRLGVTVPEVVFRFALDLGMMPLTGTTDPAHMRADLGAVGLALTDADRATLGGAAHRRGR
jgi:diketogulonate reductase-like aldo/keto reductase